MADILEQALQHFQQGDSKLAIKQLANWLKFHENDCQAAHLYGLFLAQTGKIQEALPCLQKAVKLDPGNAAFHNNLANAYKQLKDFERAHEHYEQAIKQDPNYWQAYANLAVLEEKRHHYPSALNHYIKAVNLNPSHLISHYNLGLLMTKLGKSHEAKKQFNNVLQLDETHAEAHYQLANLYLNEDKLSKAKEHYLDVLKTAPEHLDALINLGVIALKSKQGQLAIDYFSQALAIDNSKSEARNNLAATFIHHDRYENALIHYDILLKEEPQNTEYHFNSGVSQMALGHLNEAIIHFEQAQSSPQHQLDSLRNLAAIHLRIGQKEKALRYYQDIFHLDESCSIASHMIAALSHQSPLHTPPEYVSNLFNAYALNYEQHMLEILDYQVPHHLELWLKDLQTHHELIIDLGCGTGLCGEKLKPFAKKLLGVDLSSKMLEVAEKTRHYQELKCQDLLIFLNQLKEQASLILAADVLPYFGELDGLFSEVTKHLAPQGHFVFTTEISPSQDYTLQESARFCHHPDYILQLAERHDLTAVTQQQISARIQDNTPLQVIFWALLKT